MRLPYALAAALALAACAPQTPRALSSDDGNAGAAAPAPSVHYQVNQALDKVKPKD